MIGRICARLLSTCFVMGLHFWCSPDVGYAASVDSPQKALEIAVSYVGEQFVTAAREELLSSARVVALRDTTTPFLTTLAQSDRAWKVVINDVVVSRQQAHMATVDMMRSFEVFIDSLSGRLLKIQSSMPASDQFARYQLTAQQAEEQIRGNGHGDKYIEIPGNLPTVSFVDALLACRPSPLEAEEILGQYILYQEHFFVSTPASDTVTPAVPVWVVSLAGIPPVNAYGGDISHLPEYTRNRVRLIVNAQSGLLRRRSTVPHIPLAPDDIEKIWPDSVRR